MTEFLTLYRTWITTQQTCSFQSRAKLSIHFYQCTGNTQHGSFSLTFQTTAGSVDVAALDMAALVRMSSRSGLQIVGQVHTHPKTAFHSTGDLAGMRLRHPGYVSIVLPEYGKLLPRLDGAHTLLWDGSRFAAPLSATAIFEESCDGRT